MLATSKPHSLAGSQIVAARWIPLGASHMAILVTTISRHWGVVRPLSVSVAWRIVDLSRCIVSLINHQSRWQVYFTRPFRGMSIPGKGLETISGGWSAVMHQEISIQAAVLLPANVCWRNVWPVPGPELQTYQLGNCRKWADGLLMAVSELYINGKPLRSSAGRSKS